MTPSDQILEGVHPGLEASADAATQGPCPALPPERFETGAGDWVESQWSRSKPEFKLTAFQRLAVNVLVKGLATGPWNIDCDWKKADWNYGRGVRFVVGGMAAQLSTYDFDRLTRLVIAAHDAAVRLEVEPRTFRHLAITIWPREREHTSVWGRHPTMEQAIARFRETTNTPPVSDGAGNGTASDAGDGLTSGRTNQ